MEFAFLLVLFLQAFFLARCFIEEEAEEAVSGAIRNLVTFELRDVEPPRPLQSIQTVIEKLEEGHMKPDSPHEPPHYFTDWTLFRPNHRSGDVDEYTVYQNHFFEAERREKLITATMVGNFEYLLVLAPVTRTSTLGRFLHATRDGLLVAAVQDERLPIYQGILWTRNRPDNPNLPDDKSVQLFNFAAKNYNRMGLMPMPRPPPPHPPVSF